VELLAVLALTGFLLLAVDPVAVDAGLSGPADFGLFASGFERFAAVAGLPSRSKLSRDLDADSLDSKP
jgi:hypothetical protein